jgi:solute carrier family 25 protein 42
MNTESFFPGECVLPRVVDVTCSMDHAGNFVTVPSVETPRQSSWSMGAKLSMSQISPISSVSAVIVLAEQFVRRTVSASDVLPSSHNSRLPTWSTPQEPPQLLKSLVNKVSAPADLSVRPSSAPVLRNPLEEATRHPRDSGNREWHVAAKSFLAGGFSGALAKTIIAPLDRIKILFQISHMPFTFRAVLQELQRTVSQEGARALFKGNAAQVLRVYPYSGVQLMSFDQFAKLIQRLRRPNEVATGHHHSPGSRLKPMEKLAAGSMAGALSVTVTYPLDLMRARLAVSVESASGANAYQSQGLIRTAMHMYNAQGMMSFYRGMMPTLLGIVPYAGISFMAFEQLKQMWADGNGETGTVGKLLAGGIAGLAGQTSTYPLDIVRRRMQTEGFSPIHAHNEANNVSPHGKSNVESTGQRMQLHTSTRATPLHPLEQPFKTAVDGIRSLHSSAISEARKGGMVDTTMRIIRRDGVRGLFKGLSMNMVKGPIGVGVSFTTYDIIKHFLDLE